MAAWSGCIFWMSSGDIALLGGQTLEGVTGSLFYMSTLAMLYLYFIRLRKVLMLMGNIGRMSLSCYIAHSIIGTLLFLGYGFGAADGIQPSGILAVCFGVYVVLMAASYGWLKRFRYGPLEWLWRKLTYGTIAGGGSADTRGRGIQRQL